MKSNYFVLLCCVVLLVPDFLSARQTDSPGEQREGQREVKAVINPSNPGLFSYIAERDNTLRIAYVTGRNRFADILQLCRYAEIVRDDIGREEELISNISCDDLNWRPVLDEDGRYWFMFVSRAENRIYAGFLSHNLDCSGNDNCGYFQLNIALPGDGAILRPKWSPDGDMFLFEFGGNILKVSEIGSPQSLSDKSIVPLVFIENGSYPDWSSNQEFIAFERNGDVLVFNYRQYLRNPRIDYYSVNRNLPADRVFEKSRPTWSSNSTHLSYFIPETSSSITDSEENFTWNILVRTLITEGDDFGFRPLNRERFQVRSVSRTRDTLSGPFIVNLLTDGSERVYSGFINNDPENNFPVILRSLRSDGRQLSTTLSRTEHVNNDYLTMMPSRNRIHFIYSSQQSGELKLNLGTWESQDYEFTPSYTFQNVGSQQAFTRSLLFPGWGQIYKGQNTKGLGLMAGSALLIGSGVYFGIEAQNALNEYNRQLNQFRSLINDNQATPSQLAEVRKRRDDALDSQRRNNSLQTACLSLFAFAYIYNLYDVRQGFPIYKRVSKERVERRISINADLISANNGSAYIPGIQLTLNGF